VVSGLKRRRFIRFPRSCERRLDIVFERVLWPSGCYLLNNWVIYFLFVRSLSPSPASLWVRQSICSWGSYFVLNATAIEIHDLAGGVLYCIVLNRDISTVQQPNRFRHLLGVSTEYFFVGYLSLTFQ